MFRLCHCDFFSYDTIKDQAMLSKIAMSQPNRTNFIFLTTLEPKDLS